MTDPGAILGHVIHQRTAELTRERLRGGCPWDDWEALQGSGERTP